MRSRRFSRRGFSTEVLAETPDGFSSGGLAGSPIRRRIQARTSRAAVPGMISTARAKEWSGHGADLVEGLVHTHAATESDRAGGMSQQSRLGRTAHGFAEPFGQDQEAGER